MPELLPPESAGRPLPLSDHRQSPLESSAAASERVTQLDNALELLARLGVEVREESLGGEGGGLCKLRGRAVFFLDRGADPATNLELCIAALADMPEADEHFIIPTMRERIERVRESRSG